MLLALGFGPTDARAAAPCAESVCTAGTCVAGNCVAGDWFVGDWFTGDCVAGGCETGGCVAGAGFWTGGLPTESPGAASGPAGAAKAHVAANRPHAIVSSSRK